ncbi:unnamed protein product [Dicrocoelium dendriticum]|nr:unnamed protein product [Dicrocoelium dendriticum]
MSPSDHWAKLERFKIKNFPPQLYYIPDFITEAEEEQLSKHIYASPVPKWVVLSGRRLQNWGGIPHPKGMLVEPIPQWLLFLMDRVSDLHIFGGHRANHALINEYTPGQGISPHHDGPLYYPVVATINLGSHGVLDFYKPLPSCDMECHEKWNSTSYDARYIGSALLHPRSMNVVTGELYTHYMHGISCSFLDKICAEGENYSLDQPTHLFHPVNCTVEDSGHVFLLHAGQEMSRGTRISITIRYVPKIANLDISRILNKNRLTLACS